MSRIFIYFSIVTYYFVCGCRTLKESDFIVNESLTTLIPPLQGTVDLNNLKANIPFGNVKLSGHYNGILKVNQDFDSMKIVIEHENFSQKDQRLNPDLYYSKAEYLPDERINDMIKLFSREVNSKTSQTDTSFCGTIKLDILSFKEKRNHRRY